MEKFAVDLDKVLDELELSEDCAEQMVHHSKDKYDLSPEPVCNYLKGDAALGFQSAGDRDSAKAPLSKREFNLTSVFQFSQDVPPKKSAHSHIHQESTGSFSQTDHKRDSNTSSERCSSNTKLNVNTVFSCLQEYINTGNVTGTQKNSVGNTFILKGESNKYVKENNTYSSQGSLDNEYRQTETAANVNHRDDFSVNFPNSHLQFQHASNKFQEAYSCKDPSDNKVQCDAKDRVDASNQSTDTKQDRPVVNEMPDHKSVYLENKDEGSVMPGETHMCTGFRMSMDNSLASSGIVSDESSPLEKLEFDFHVSCGKSHLSDSLNVEKKYEDVHDKSTNKTVNNVASSGFPTNESEFDGSLGYEAPQETLLALYETAGPGPDCHNTQLSLVFKADEFSEEELTECLRELELAECDIQNQVFDGMSSEIIEGSVISNNNENVTITRNDKFLPVDSSASLECFPSEAVSSASIATIITNALPTANNETSAEITSTNNWGPAVVHLPVGTNGTDSISQNSSERVSLSYGEDPEVSSSTAAGPSAQPLSTSVCAAASAEVSSCPNSVDSPMSGVSTSQDPVPLAALGSSGDNVTSISVTTVNSTSCSLVTDTPNNSSAAISETARGSVNDCDTHIVTSSVKELGQVDTDSKCSKLECDSTRDCVKHYTSTLGNKDFPVIIQNGGGLVSNKHSSEVEITQTEGFISVESSCPVLSPNITENCNTISADVLSTQKNTSNVHSVLSIECQQTNTKIFGKDRVLLPTNISKVVSNDDLIGGNKAGSSEDACGGENDSVREVISSLDLKMTSDCNGEETTEESAPKHTQLSNIGKQYEELGVPQAVAKRYPQSLSLSSKITVESQEGSEKTTCNIEDSTGETDVSEHMKVDNADISQYSNASSDMASPDASESSVEVAALPFMQTNSSNQEPLTCLTPEERNLGKVPPFWVPDGHAPVCMLCNNKFTVLKRRHHCRACGKVFCSKCCNLKFRLEYMDNADVRVCQVCYTILARVLVTEQQENESEISAASGGMLPEGSNASTPVGRQPNPNNPMEYCSTIPPLEQVASSVPQPVPSVLVPVGVLKREGCNRFKNDVTKQVIFSDGIRPGGDLMDLDRGLEPHSLYQRTENTFKHGASPLPGYGSGSSSRPPKGLEAKTRSYIPSQGLPPLASIVKGDLQLEEVGDVDALLDYMQLEPNAPVMFALNKNLFVDVKILNLECCVQRICWCFSTTGMCCVGQDEIMILVEYSLDSICYLRDIFSHLNNIYLDASQGNLLNEMGHTTFKGVSFFGSTDHGGFMFIRPSFQCLQKLILPDAPYLVGILIHRWEVPWAKVFPIRLMLRLGAEFRYYPCMLVSVPHRKPVYGEIGHTIMNLLTDFRNLSYTLPSVRGMVIHMEDRHTSILLPKNRYDQVTQALNNSNDHVLALAANFSLSADSHLVCVQSPSDDTYHTQAINIHNKPREVTGASFVVFNGALKTSSNLTAKSRIVEDGLMVQITQDMIQELRTSLHKMQDFTVRCGPINAASPDETVDIKWVDDDTQFNVGVLSVIDNMALNGVPSIRVHNGSDYLSKLRLIRWTEVFILQSGDKLVCTSDPLDISRVSENLATAACIALCDYLDLLAQGGLTKIAVRANIDNENVGYVVGSRGEKLPPIYMKSLDNALVPVLHRAASLVPESPPVVLELIFHIMLQ